MDYEKKYKEALAKARNIVDSINVGLIGKDSFEAVFPELKEDKDEKIRKALIRFHKSTIDVDGIKGEDIIAWLKKQGEQKCTYQLDNLKSNIKFPFKAKVKSSGTIVTICNGQLSPDSKKWIRYQSDRKDGYKVYEPDNLELVCEIEQNSAWSEEDEEYMRYLHTLVNNTASYEYGKKVKCFLKSFRPQKGWKPSGLQIEALESATGNCAYSEYVDCLKELIKQLKQL